MTAYFFSNSAIIKKAEKLLADDDYDAAKAIFNALGSYENSFHFSSFILDTPYVFVCPPENKKSSGTSSISPERAVRQLCHSCGRFRIRHYFSVDLADTREWSNCVSARLLYHTAPGLSTRFCTRRHLTFSPPLGYNKFYGTRPLLKQNTEV